MILFSQFEKLYGRRSNRSVIYPKHSLGISIGQEQIVSGNAGVHRNTCCIINGIDSKYPWCKRGSICSNDLYIIDFRIKPSVGIEGHSTVRDVYHTACTGPSGRRTSDTCGTKFIDDGHAFNINLMNRSCTRTINTRVTSSNGNIISAIGHFNFPDTFSAYAVWPTSVPILHVNQRFFQNTYTGNIPEPSVRGKI